MNLIFKPTWNDDHHQYELKMVGAPASFDSIFTGNMLAHDLMEHFDHEGTLQSEFMAFGCMLWGRWEGGYRYRFNDVSHDLTFGRWVAADFITMYEDDHGEPIDHELVYVSEIPRWNRFLEANLHKIEEDTMASLIDLETNLLLRASGYEDEAAFHQFVKCLLDWIKVGYLRAQARGEAVGMSSEMFTEMYYQFKNMVDRLFTENRYWLKDGQEFTMHARVMFGKSKACAYNKHPLEGGRLIEAYA